MKMLKIFLCLATVVLFFNGCSDTVQSTNETAQNFTLEDIAGNSVSLYDYSGKVVLLNFFTTWCPPCKYEIPDFVEITSELINEKFVIIGVAIDTQDKEKLKKFKSSLHINYPLLIDDGMVSSAYGPISSIPTTFLIDKKGNIVEKIIGSRKKPQLLEIIKPLL